MGVHWLMAWTSTRGRLRWRLRIRGGRGEKPGSHFQPRRVGQPLDPQARIARASPEWQHSMQDAIAVHKQMLDCGAGVYCDQHRKRIRAVVMDVDKNCVYELVVWRPGR